MEYEQNLRETNGNETLVECSTRFQRLLQDVSQQSADRKKLNKLPMSYVMAMRVCELNCNTHLPNLRRSGYILSNVLGILFASPFGVLF